MVLGRLRGADPPAGARLAGDRRGRVDADSRADRQRQDADGVSLVPRSADVRARAAQSGRCRVLYVSPLKALAVDVERNLRAPLAGIAQIADGRGDAYLAPAIAIRTGDTPQSERARFPAGAGRHPDHDARVALPAADVAARARRCARSTRSSSTRSTRWCRPSAARIWRCRSSGWRRSASVRRSGSACRRRSARSMKWRVSWAARSPAANPRSNPHSALRTPHSRRPRSSRSSPFIAPSAIARSPSSTRARRRRSSSRSRCRSRTWRS